MTIKSLSKTRFVYIKSIKYSNPNTLLIHILIIWGNNPVLKKIMNTLKHLPLLYVF